MQSGYGVGVQAERQAAQQTAERADQAPNTPGMYLALIDKMQDRGLYYASLAHIDAFEKQYGVTPDTRLLRADALRETEQPEAAAEAYSALLDTPLAARGYHGLGLLAGAAGDFTGAAKALEQASRLSPVDATVLSDLAYARLREGDVAGARVPLFQAAELDQGNPKITGNMVLYLMAAGRTADARELMANAKLPEDARETVRHDAHAVQIAERGFRNHGTKAERSIHKTKVGRAIRQSRETKSAPEAKDSGPAKAGTDLKSGTDAKSNNTVPDVSDPVTPKAAS
jgi:Flp pilus assembly protein TadD